MSRTTELLRSMEAHETYRWATDLFDHRDYYTAAEVLQHLLKTATVGEAPKSTGVVEPGTVVTALVAGGEEVFLLGSREIAAGSDLDVYSEASPLGSAILGRREGEKTSYTAPNGREIDVEIVKVETYDGR